MALNTKSRGGKGDPERTLKVCKALISDPEIIVQKAISWALRELVPWDRSAVETFLDQHDENVSALVKREVKKKLVTGKKNQPGGFAAIEPCQHVLRIREMKLARMPDGSPEIFHTIQGEGRSIGMPTIFIRSSLCNLHCQWCDTAYTWNWEDTNFATESGKKYRREDQIVSLPIEEIANHVGDISDCPNFVFTGGEPLLQQRDWTALMKYFRKENPEQTFHFEIETNGTLAPNDGFLESIHQLNISPKLANTGVAEKLRIKPDALFQLATLEKSDFKFVIESDADFAEMQQLVSDFGIRHDRVFLMPKANSIDELDANSNRVADFCKDHGFRFSDRLHIRLFGAKRGV